MIMCTMIVENAKVTGSAKGPDGWFKLKQASVSYDHPFNVQLEYALNIDFVDPDRGPSARVAVELSAESARNLVRSIEAALARAEAEVGPLELTASA